MSEIQIQMSGGDEQDEGNRWSAQGNASVNLLGPP